MKKITSEIASSITLTANFIKNNAFLALSILFLSFLTYGYELANFTLTNDEEYLFTTAKMSAIAIQYSRPMMELITSIFANGGYFPPFFSQAVSIIFLALATLILSAVLFKIDDKINKVILFIASGIFLSVPFVVTEFFIFTNFNLLISIGLVLTSFTTIFTYNYLTNKGVVSLIMLAFFGLLTSFIYQGLIPALIVANGSIFIYFVDRNETKDTLKNILKLSATFIVMIAIYFIGYYICKLFAPSTAYIENVLSTAPTSQSASIPLLQKVGNYAIKYLDSTLSGSKHFAIIFVQFIISSAIILHLLFRKKGNLKIILPALAIIILLPHIFIRVILPSLQMRTLILFLYSSYFAFFYIMIITPKIRFFKFIIISLSLVFMLHNIQIVNRIFYGDHLKYQQDVRILSNIMDDIISEVGSFKIDKPILFITSDNLDYGNNVIRLGEVGRPVFIWYNSIDRIPHFLKAHGYDVLLDGMLKYKDKSYTIASSLPKYPKKGYFKVEDDFIVVNMGAE